MATPPTGSLWDLHSNRIEEILNRNIKNYSAGADPTFEEMAASNMGVEPSDQIGRDFKIIKLMKGGLTGTFESAASRGDFPIYGDPSGQALGKRLNTKGVVNSFPDPFGSTEQSVWRIGIPMRASLGNVPIYLEELQAESMDAFIGGIVSDKMDAFAMRIVRNLCNYWWVSQNSNYKLATIPTLATYTTISTYSTTGDTFTINLQGDNYAVDRFEVGDRLQLYDTTGATLRTAASGESILVITHVDRLECKIDLMWFDASTFGSVGDGSGNTASIAATDILVYANSKGNSNTPYSASPYFTGYAGINSWLKVGDTGGATVSNANTLLGAERDTANYINVNQHDEHKSMGYNLSSKPLTEHVLRKILDRFTAAKAPYDMYIDRLVASDGVWRAYEAQKIGREILDRTGRLSSLQNEGSKKGFSFSHEGRNYMGRTSQWIESGTVYGLRVGGGNWKKIAPPDPKSVMGLGSVRKSDRLPGWCPWRFLGPAFGHKSILFPVYATNGNKSLLTSAMQAPGMLRMQWVPEQAAGIKITNVAEDRVYSTTSI